MEVMEMALRPCASRGCVHATASGVSGQFDQASGMYDRASCGNHLTILLGRCTVFGVQFLPI